MTTVLDAFVMTLGLDPKEFVKGQKQAVASIGKTREGAVREGKQIERSLDSAGEAVERLARNALKLFAVFTGGRALGTFITDIGRADAAMGRMADRLGMAPERIAAFDNAVKRAGGTAGEGSASFQRLSDTINELRTGGDSSALVPFARLQGISRQQIRLNGTLEESFGDLAEAAKGTAEKAGASTASFLLRQAGYSEATINLLLKGRAAVEKALQRSQKAGLVSKADSDAARALGEQYEDLSDRVTDFGRKISTALTPVLTDLMRRFANWLDLNKDWLKDDIVGEVTKFATALREIPWDDVGKGIQAFIKGANDAATAMGGWKTVAEIFFGLWAASKVAQVLATIAAIRSALVVGDTSLLAAMARVGLPVAIGAVAMGHGFQTPEEAAQDPDQAELQREGIDRRERFRGAVRRGWNGVKRFFGGGAEADEDDRHSDGIRRRGRRNARRVEEGGAAAPRGDGSGNARAARTGEMMRYAMDQLRREGVPEAQLRQSAAHLVGQATMESSLDPNKTHDVDASGRPTGYGIYGARLSRRDRMLRWLEKNGYARNSAEGQMRYMVHEAMNDSTYSKTRRILMGEGTGNIDADTDTITKNFESPKVINRRSGAVRNALRAGAEPAPPTQADKDVATVKAGPRKPEVLADPADERRKPMASLMYGDTPPAARTGAAAVAAQAQSAQADRLASITNDNRTNSASTSEAHFHGDMVFNGVRDSADVERNLRARLRDQQFVQAVNYGQA